MKAATRASTSAAVGLFAVAIAVFAEEEATVVVMLGDSTTLCSRSGPGAKLTDRVEAYLTKDRRLPVVVVNSGKGSDTAAGGRRRLQRDVLAHSPDVVTISFGLNDTGRRPSERDPTSTPEWFRKELEGIVVEIQAKTGAKILLVTSTPFNNARHGWRKRFEAEGGLDEYMNANICEQVRKLARKHKLRLCDLHRHFREKFAKDPKAIDTLLLTDGVHLTNEGNRVAADYLAPMIAALLAPPEAAEKK